MKLFQNNENNNIYMKGILLWHMVQIHDFFYIITISKKTDNFYKLTSHKRKIQKHNFFLFTYSIISKLTVH